MLDSGAFSYMGKHKYKGKDIDWGKYLDTYAHFIQTNDIKLFYELDIDCIVGYDEVRRMRKKLEEKTGKKSIPVWHIGRGKNEFISLCKEYSYIALGGLVSGEYPKSAYKNLRWFTKVAHDNNCRIHCLGFTPLKIDIRMFGFDSVDSTSWNIGGRFGIMYKMIGNQLIQIKKHKNKRAKNDKQKIDYLNMIEWIKFQEYMDKL